MIDTKDQFDDTTAEATAALKGFITGDDGSDENIQKRFTSEIERYYERAMTELERLLNDPPPDNNGDSLFKEDDCSNTKNTDDNGNEQMEIDSSPCARDLESRDCNASGSSPSASPSSTPPVSRTPSTTPPNSTPAASPTSSSIPSPAPPAPTAPYAQGTC